MQTTKVHIQSNETDLGVEGGYNELGRVAWVIRLLTQHPSDSGAVLQVQSSRIDVRSTCVLCERYEIQRGQVTI